MNNPVIRFFAMAWLTMLLTSFTVAAQMGGGRGQGRMMGGPFYNTGTEVTIIGSVDESPTNNGYRRDWTGGSKLLQGLGMTRSSRAVLSRPL